MAHRPGRRIVGEDYRGMYGPPQGWGPSGMSPRLSPYAHASTQPPSSVMANPEIRETYERIKERQHKLAILKQVIIYNLLSFSRTCTCACSSANGGVLASVAVFYAKRL